MPKKKILLFCLFLLVGFFAVSYRENSIRSDTSLKKEKTEVKQITDEKQVVKKAVYPIKTLEDGQKSEDILPKGSVVSVKTVPENDEWVEIIADPKKGFIKKQVLAPRSTYIKNREKKRKKKLDQSQFKTKMDQELTEFMAKNGGDISVYLKTTDDKFTYNFYGDEIKRTASSIKLPCISYVMELADKGEIDLDSSLTYTKQFKIDGTGIIQFAPIGSSYTIKELAELSIRYSDNVAYLMLLDLVGEPNFIQYLAELDEDSPDNRVFSTAKILTESMDQVYKNRKNSSNTNLLYQWMQQTVFDNGVAVGLPGVDVAHKTGWMPMYTVSNDVALIEDQKNPYIMTIMTNGYDEKYGAQVLADLAVIIDDNMLMLK